MWNAYSASYIRNNKNGNLFIMVISFLASMMLSLVSGLFYNLWADQVKQTVFAKATFRDSSRKNNKKQSSPQRLCFFSL